MQCLVSLFYFNNISNLEFSIRMHKHKGAKGPNPPLFRWSCNYKIRNQERVLLLADVTTGVMWHLKRWEMLLSQASVDFGPFLQLQNTSRNITDGTQQNDSIVEVKNSDNTSHNRSSIGKTFGIYIVFYTLCYW